jgi:TonB family protein
MKNRVGLGICLLLAMCLNGISFWAKAQNLALHNTASAPALNTDAYPTNLAAFKAAVGYPEKAREAQIQGRVVLRVEVSPEGRYVRHMVLKSPHPMLTELVQKHAAMLQFTPATSQGKSVAEWVTIPLDFRLH